MKAKKKKENTKYLQGTKLNDVMVRKFILKGRTVKHAGFVRC